MPRKLRRLPPKSYKEPSPSNASDSELDKLDFREERNKGKRVRLENEESSGRRKKQHASGSGLTGREVAGTSGKSQRSQRWKVNDTSNAGKTREMRDGALGRKSGGKSQLSVTRRLTGEEVPGTSWKSQRSQRSKVNDTSNAGKTREMRDGALGRKSGDKSQLSVTRRLTGEEKKIENGILKVGETGPWTEEKETMTFNVWTKVFEEFLGVPDLKACRLVCSDWNKIATSELLARHSLKINICFNEIDRTYRVGTPKSTILLDHLNSVIRSAGKSFPCRKFEISDGNMSKPSLNCFLTTASSFAMLEGLHLSLISNFKIFLELMKINAPSIQNLAIRNLSILDLEGAPMFFSTFPLEHANVLFPKLKILRLQATSWNSWNADIFKSIVIASPNLDGIEEFDCQLLQYIDVANICRVNLIKSVTVRPTEREFGLYLKFANLSPKLERICILPERNKYETHVDYLNVVSRILKSSSETLTKMTLYPSHVSCFLDIKSFPVLKELTLHEGKVLVNTDINVAGNEAQSNVYTYFYDAPQLRPNIFPTLTNISIGFPLTKEFANNLLPCGTTAAEFIEPLLTVRVVKIENQIDEIGLNFLAKTFPNVTSMKMGRTLYPTSKVFWDILPGGLSHLEIEPDSFLEEETDGILSLDSILTGFPKHTCDGLYFLQVLPNGMWNGSNICLLTNLRNLRIAIPRLGPSVNFTLTHVAGIHAFQRHPQLRVTVAYDWHNPCSYVLESHLKLVGPYVTFEHSTFHEQNDCSQSRVSI